MDTVLIPILSVIAAVAIVAVVITRDEAQQYKTENSLLRHENQWLQKSRDWVLSELGRSDEPHREPRT